MLKKRIVLLLTLTLGFAGHDINTNATTSDIPVLPPAIHTPHTIPATGTMEVAFSPNGGAAETVINAITEAKTDIRVQAYLFSYAPIAQALADAQNRGIQVRIILDKNQKTSTHSSVNFFTAHHIPTKFDESFHTAHNKIIIIDDNTVITGSFNFIKTAEEKNAENVLIIRGNKKLADLYIKNWEWRWKNSVAVFPIDHT